MKLLRTPFGIHGRGSLDGGNALYTLLKADTKIKIRPSFAYVPASKEKNNIRAVCRCVFLLCCVFNSKSTPYGNTSEHPRESNREAAKQIGRCSDHDQPSSNVSFGTIPSYRPSNSPCRPDVIPAPRTCLPSIHTQTCTTPLLLHPFVPACCSNPVRSLPTLS